MTLFPMFLKLDDQHCLVVGAGKIAESKIESLISAGARTTVVAPDATAVVEQWSRAGKIEWKSRLFAAEDLDGMLLVIAATDVQSVNHLVAESARAKGILCNSVDDPPDCDFYYPSVVQRGDLQVAISTAGKSPSLAQRLRVEIDGLLPKDSGEWLDALGRQRSTILSALPAGELRKKILHQLAEREHCNPNECPVQKTLDELLDAKPSVGEVISTEDSKLPEGAQSGTVYLVGAGPGSAELLTMRAHRLIASANCLLHDDLVSDEILALGRADARVMNVGKRCGKKSITQDRIHELMVEYSRAGFSVVRLKSGEPNLFGRASEEMAALRSANVPFEIVPGISAGFAAAAAAGVSLTGRKSNSRAVLMTRHLAADKMSSFDGLDPSSALVLYMPGKEYASLQEDLRISGWPEDAICILVSSVSTPKEQIAHTTLRGLSEVSTLPAPVVILILPPSMQDSAE